MLLNRLVAREDLTRDEAHALMGAIMAGEIEHIRSAAILTALRMKGETVEEISGFVTALRDKAIRVTPKSNGTVDTCGTGGDAQHTFNISTATAFVAAGMGIPVAKHGNRAVSSKCGSSDVLDALGIRSDLSPQAIADLVDRAGIGFMFAPAHHPAMKNVVPVRQQMGIRTVFNLLGPMANPAFVKRQLVGVFDPSLTEVVANTLRALGSEKVFVVHGMEGTDEVSIGGETRVTKLENDSVETVTMTPEDVGIERRDISELGGGNASENAKHIMDVLSGQAGAKHDAVVLNAAYVAVVADKATDLKAGADLARHAIESGAALDRLHALRDLSNSIEV